MGNSTSSGNKDQPLPTEQKDDISQSSFGINPDENGITKVDVDLPNDFKGKVAFVLYNVFTPEECKELIKITEKKGYEKALVNVGFGRQVSLPKIRNSDRCIWDSFEEADRIWQRIKKYVPSQWRKRKAMGLNERLRFLKYHPGDYFKPHLDGEFARDSGEKSFVTVQLYLNEGFEGGETTFMNFNHKNLTPVVPKTGCVLVFQHDIMHEGSELKKGVKYAVRTDVMYAAKPSHDIKDQLLPTEQKNDNVPQSKVSENAEENGITKDIDDKEGPLPTEKKDDISLSSNGITPDENDITEDSVDKEMPLPTEQRDDISQSSNGINPDENGITEDIDDEEGPLPTEQKDDISQSSVGINPDENGITKVDVDLPNDFKGKVAFILYNVFTPEECKEYIKITEKKGYEKALVNVGFGRQRSIPEVRNNDRCIWDSFEEADRIWQRIKKYVPSQWRKRKAMGLNERLRFLKYHPGEYFKPHLDGEYARDNGEKSFVTVQLYLNEGFEGGETTFMNFNLKNLIPVVPKTGCVLIFQHDIMHEGSELKKGVKYAVRTDVMYAAKPSQ